MIDQAALNPLYTVSGLVVGMMVGLTGVGGGALMTPLLVLFFGIHPATAVGTDLLYAAVTKSVGTAVHGFNGTVDWQLVRRLATGSAPATAVTVLLLYLLGAHGEPSGEVISFVLGLAVLMTAALLLLRGWLLRTLSERFGTIAPRKAAVLTVLTGVVLGVLVSLSSVGAGALGVTVLFLLYPRIADGTDRRLRHRPCGAADAAGRHRPLGARLGRLASAAVAADRLDPRHRRRQPGRRARAGLGDPPGAGLRADAGRGAAGVLSRIVRDRLRHAPAAAAAKPDRQEGAAAQPARPQPADHVACRWCWCWRWRCRFSTAAISTSSRAASPPPSPGRSR